MPHRRIAPLALLALLAVFALLVTTLTGCSALVGTPPAPTPVDFAGVTTQLAARGIAVADYRSGDAGCQDRNLIPTAIGFHAGGLDQAAPVYLRLYIFKDRDAFDRRRADVDTCARAWATDPQTFEFVDAPPYVLAGQGPWGPKFHAALRDALVAAAGAAP